jgi:hypothetical protein
LISWFGREKSRSRNPIKSLRAGRRNTHVFLETEDGASTVMTGVTASFANHNVRAAFFQVEN